MYIKQVIIQGFRSYRDQTVVEPFSPKHNVIVGRNGSGKSNFFYAIQFVLSDEFSHLRADQRQALLHEGTGPRAFNAYVEIVFDNSDNRLPFDKDEVRLRRWISSKKDQYSIDGKTVTRQDVMNLLESAGFSRSNPYYIVKQGKINELATAADSMRLKLLREVAGTRVYDERKEESQGILKETENKAERIVELLKYIDDRLKKLEEEKEELKQYQKWDKMRRALEYTIYDHDLQETRRKIDEMYDKRERYGEENRQRNASLQEALDKLYSLQKQLNDLERRYTGQEDERSQLAAEQSERFENKTKLELTIRDLREEVDGERSSRRKAEEELRDLRQTIADKQARLDDIAPRFNELLQKEQKNSTELAIADQKRRELYNKQGWTDQFRSVDERDAWIKRNLRKLNSQIIDKREQIAKLHQESQGEQRRYEDVERRLAELNQQMEQQREAIEGSKRQNNELKQQRDTLQTERHELWREETTITQSLQAKKDELDQADMALRAMTGKAIIHGIDSVNRVLDSFRERGIQNQVLDGYYGTLIENFETDQQFRTAVEVTAGNRLFYHIVETDRIGTKILDEFNKQKLPGEVNFFPLNRLDVRDVDYPNNPNAVPMIGKLRYEDKFAIVLKHVFGRTLICRNMEVATQLARPSGLDCITLEGDQVSHKGSLTGGYYDNRRSRLQLQELRNNLRQQLEELEERLQQQRARLNEIEGQNNHTVSEMQKLETKNAKVRDAYDKLQQDLRLLREERQQLQQSKEPKDRQLAAQESTLTQLEAQKERMESELGTELLSQLTVNEQQQLDNLQQEIEALKSQGKAVLEERSKLEHEKNRLENQLQVNLLRKKEQLTAKLQEMSIEDRRNLLEAHQSELNGVNKRISEITRQLADLGEQLSDYYDKKKDLEAEIEQWQTAERDLQAKLSEEAKEMELMHSKQNLLTQKKDDCVKKIRELGSLPSDAFDKYQNLNTKQLFKKLEQCNQELKKYENVNKKALDQFVSFSEQKEKLMKRKDELDRGRESIIDLMNVLDQRKYDAIQLTFKQVSKYFEDVLARLAPGSRGQLQMRTSEPSVSEETGASQDLEASPRSLPLVEQVTGVGITVAFSGSDETREMQQLSGGQKSLVALALIFAIQKCDPAPFYLFDEIDAALDAQHRKAVADMTHDLSQNAQFITTTFRRELLENADKFYGVCFRNKVSHIACVTKEEAADFVEDDTTHG